MGRRTIWRPTGASCAATFVSVLFPILLHLTLMPFYTSASEFNTTAGITTPEASTTVPPQPACDCNASSFCYNSTCVPLLNLNLTVLAVTSNGLTFSWSIIDEKNPSLNVSLHLKCTTLDECPCKASDMIRFNRKFTVDDLDSSQLVLFTATARWNDTEVSHPINKTVLTRPLLPDNITIITVNSTAVRVGWTPYEACVNTSLEIQNTANNTVLGNASISDGGEGILIGSLVPGTKSSLQMMAVVTADGKVGKSNLSLHSVTLRPMPPERLLTTKTSSSLNVTFKAPAIGVYKYFELEYLLSNGTWVVAGNTKNTSNFVLVSGLRPFSMYRLRARTFSFELFSSYYEDNATTGEYRPSAPAVVEHNDSLVTWRRPDTPNGIILGYEVHWTLSCGMLAQVENRTVIFPAAKESWPIPSGFELLGYRHCVRVRANNSFSFGNWSPTSCWSKPMDSTIGPQLNISASTNTASVAWSSTTCPGFVIGYFLLLQLRNPDNFGIKDACILGSQRLICSKCNSSDVNNLFASLTSDCGGNARNETFESELTKVTITSLQPGYIYRLTLYSAGSNRSLHNISRNFSAHQVRSNPPEKISTTDASDKALAVTWDPPRAPGGLLLHYLAWIDTNPPQCLLCNCTGCEKRADYMTLTGQGRQQVQEAINSCQLSSGTICNFRPQQGPTSSIRFNNLSPFTNFTVYVSAINRLGLGSSNASAQSTTQEGKPDPPTSVNITAVTDTSVTVVWSPSPNPKGILRAYFVNLSNSGGSKQIKHTDTLANFTNLSACTAYAASLTAANSVQNSSLVSSKQKLTRPIQPAPVANLKLLVIDSTKLKATWNPVENFGNCTVSYNVALQSTDSVRNNKTAEASFVFESLKPFTEYTAKVVAVVTSSDGSSLESLARNHSTTTKEGVPSSPRNLQCQPINYTSIGCSWKEPIPTNGRIKNYELEVQPPALHTPYNVSGNIFSTVFTMPNSVSSGQTIAVNVKAFTSVAFGRLESSTTQLPDGPPAVDFTPEIERAMGKDPYNVANKQTQVKIHYNIEWFGKKRGKITHLTIIVSECCKNLSSMSKSEADDSSSISTWFSSNVGKSNPYAALKVSVNNRKRRKRSISGVNSVDVGTDDCPKRNQMFCNGPLTPDTKYSMYVRGYTSKGFSTLGPVKVSTSPPPDHNLVIGLVVSFLLVAILAFVGFLVYKRRNRRDDEKPSVSPVHGTNGTLTQPSEIQMTLFNATNASVSDLAKMVSEGREVDIPVEDFEEFVEDMDKDSRLKYSDAFSEVKKKAAKNEIDLGLTMEEAGQQYNRLKNRFANVLPFDQTRVCLSSDDDPCSGMDYINANFVSGYRRKREFIACQGPLPQTVDDFWRMLWEQNVSLVVMLTKTVEKGRNKCEQYWPNEIDETRVYGDIAVRLLSESVVTSYIVRVCSLTLKGDDSRVLTHLQMITWDDFLAPSAEDLTGFMRAYRSHLPPPNTNRTEGPTVVHCSAGVGRTGTFICLDTLIRRLESGHRSINVNAAIYEMRRQRRMLVQSERQYIFIHDFLVSYLWQRRQTTASAAYRLTMVNDDEEEKEGSASLLDANASHVNNAYEKEDIL